LKAPVQNKDENSLVNNLVHSTNFTRSVPDTDTQYFPQHGNVTTGNIQNQESYSLDTTLDQAVIDSNASTIINHNTEITTHLCKTNVVESNCQQEERRPILNEATNLASISNAFLDSRNTRHPDINDMQDCVHTLSKSCRENYETRQNFVTTDYCRAGEDSGTGSYSVTPALSMQTDTTENMSVLELEYSPSTVSTSTATAELPVDYQIMESPDTSSVSICSSISITSISSENAVNSSSTFLPSIAGSPVHSDYINNKD
jgi:hypothetical protein